MNGRNPPSTHLPSAGDSTGNSPTFPAVRPPDKFNLDLSDLIDDLIALAYTDSDAGTPDAGGCVVSNLTQRIASLRVSIQEAKELCRPSPKGGRTVFPIYSSVTSTVSTPRSKATPAAPNSTDAVHSLSLFQSACDLDPIAQQRLLCAVATACVAKRNLLVELKQELFDLKMQNDHFSI